MQNVYCLLSSLLLLALVFRGRRWHVCECSVSMDDDFEHVWQEGFPCMRLCAVEAQLGCGKQEAR
jgi:hypothetical protein